MAEQASAWTSAFEQGSFVRKSSEFRTTSPRRSFEPASGRYHLYVSHACPWAHRTLLTRALLGLEDAISVDVVDWRMQNDGSWIFNPDEPEQRPTRLDSTSLEEVYAAADRRGPRPLASERCPSCGTVITAPSSTTKPEIVG